MKVTVTGTRGIPNIMGGIETHCEELYPRVVTRGYPVTVFRRSDYVQDQRTSYQGVDLVDIPSPRKKAFEAIIHTLRAIHQAKFRLHADVVHVHAVGPALAIPYARLLGMKVVFTHHGPDYERAKWGKAARLMLRLGERCGVKMSHQVIVISEVIRELVARKYGRSDAQLIYNGVSAPRRENDLDYLQQLGTTAGQYLLATGRFVPEKNFHQLINAFDAIEDKHGFRLVIAGDADFEDSYSRELKELARQKGVILPGFIKGGKLWTLLNNAHSFVLPSSHEGLPISLLEAMNYGLPVLASDIPANQAVGLPRECYFTTGNTTELQQKLEQLIACPPTRIDYDMTKYDWDFIAEQTAKVYSSV